MKSFPPLWQLGSGPGRTLSLQNRKGGAAQGAELSPRCGQPFRSGSFDVVTLLEVPEHIHLLTKDILTDLFGSAGCTKLHFSGVNGHLIMMAAVNQG